MVSVVFKTQTVFVFAFFFLSYPVGFMSPTSMYVTVILIINYRMDMNVILCHFKIKCQELRLFQGTRPSATCMKKNFLYIVYTVSADSFGLFSHILNHLS